MMGINTKDNDGYTCQAEYACSHMHGSLEFKLRKTNDKHNVKQKMNSITESTVVTPFNY